MADPEGVTDEMEKMEPENITGAAVNIKEENKSEEPADDLYEVERIVGTSKVHVSFVEKLVLHFIISQNASCSDRNVIDVCIKCYKLLL